jgi:hypothetical protein
VDFCWCRSDDDGARSIWMVLPHELEEEDEDAEARTSGSGSYRPAHSMSSAVSWKHGRRTRGSLSGLAPVRLECPGRRVSKGWRGGGRWRNIDKLEKLLSWHERYRGKSQWNISTAPNVPVSKALEYSKTCVFNSPVYVISCLTFSQAYQMVEVSEHLITHLARHHIRICFDSHFNHSCRLRHTL